MHTHPSPNTQTNGSNLFLFYPNARMTLISIPVNRKIPQSPQHNFLKVADITMEVFPSLPQVNNGVAHELARSMISDIPTSIDKKEGYPVTGQLLPGNENII